MPFGILKKFIQFGSGILPIKVVTMAKKLLQRLKVVTMAK